MSNEKDSCEKTDKSEVVSIEKLAKEIDGLKKAIHTLSEKQNDDLKYALDNASEISKMKTLSEDKLEELETILAHSKSIDENLTAANTNAEEIEKLAQKISKASEDAKVALDDIISKKATCDSETKLVSDDVETAKSQALQAKAIYDKIVSCDETTTEYESKIESCYKKAMNATNSITKAHNLIYGYEEKDSQTGKTKHVDGQKDELEKTYDVLQDKFNSLENEFDALKQEKFEEIDNDYQQKSLIYENLKEQITSLLPGAMSAGLSYAYAQKSNAEIEQCEKYEQSFGWMIFALTCISLIPLLVSIYLFYGKGLDILKVLEELPRLACGTIFLYIPTFWRACFLNKKINLSKRLIEEYAYKETLSKTYEGLAKQIENLDDDDETSKKLKVKLLFNVVGMTSENPGKLIKGYNKTDHPFEEIIDKSVNLTNALEKMSHVPGIGNIASSLLDIVAARQEEKVSQGLKCQTHDKS